MATKKQPKPNEQRSDVKNPNNPAHQKDAENRANQRAQNKAPKKGR